MPSTSITSARSPSTHAPGPLRRREVPVEEYAEPLAGRGREGAPDSVMTAERERARAPRPARLAQARQHPPEHHARRRHVPHEIRDHRFHAHRLVLLVPDVVVGDERHRRVAELGLAGQLGLRHVGHADDVDMPQRAIDVATPPSSRTAAPRCRCRSRPGAPVLRLRAPPSRARRPDPAHRIGHAHVRRRCRRRRTRRRAAGCGRRTARGSRCRAGGSSSFMLPTALDRDHGRGAQRLEPVDVGAEVHLRRA